MSEKTSSAIESLDLAMKMATKACDRKELAELKSRLPPAPPPSMEFVRIQAIRGNAGPATHELLDRVGVPFVSEADASRLAAHAIDGLHVNAFKELQRQHPDAMRLWLSAKPALGSLKIAYGAATGKLTQKRRALFEWATVFGADWSLHRPGIAKDFPEGLSRYDEAVAWGSAQALHANARPAPAPAPAPAPLRRRF